MSTVLLALLLPQSPCFFFLIPACSFEGFPFWFFVFFFVHFLFSLGHHSTTRASCSWLYLFCYPLVLLFSSFWGDLWVTGAQVRGLFGFRPCGKGLPCFFCVLSGFFFWFCCLQLFVCFFFLLVHIRSRYVFCFHPLSHFFVNN